MRGREICDLLSINRRVRAARANHASKGVGSDGASSAGDAKREAGRSFRSGEGVRTADLRLSRQPARASCGAGELGYGSTTAAKEVAPQIAAQSPSDTSEITIKDVLVSGRLSAVRFSNASAGSPQAPRDRILRSTRFPPIWCSQIPPTHHIFDCAPLQVSGTGFRRASH